MLIFSAHLQFDANINNFDILLPHYIIQIITNSRTPQKQKNTIYKPHIKINKQ